jgi:class 3 adenylate cyclase/HEAT repeat protein
MIKPGVKFFKHVFLDVVDYSKRTIEAQSLIVTALNEIIQATLDDLTISETERVLIPAGDGLCIALLGAVENYDLHVRLALSILHSIDKHNEQSSENDRFQVRIGINQNTDNLVVDINGNPNVAGNGINLAARIMGLADGAQILVSQVVQAELYKRETYQGKLRELPLVKVKHGEPVQVSQYVQEGFPGLDCNLPTKWRSDSADQSRESGEAIDRPAPPPEPLSEQAQAQAIDTALAEPEPSTAERPSGEQQIAEAVGALNKSVQQGDFARGTQFSSDLDDFRLLRLQLLTSTWLVTQIPSSMLGIHEANRLYLHRESLRPTSPEFVSLLRMLISDHLAYIPGWYWFDGIEEKEIETVILHLAFTDPHSPVKQMAFDLLSSARVPLPNKARERMSQAVTSDSSLNVRRAALLYIGSVGDHTYLPIVGSALVDRERTVSYQAKESKYLLLARSEPDRALKELLGETGVEVEEILNELLPKVREIKSATLLKALDHSEERIRFFAISVLIERGEFSVELATRQKEDKYDPIKAIVYRYLIKQGTEIDAETIAYDVPDDHFSRIASRSLIVRPSPPIEREQILLEFYRRYSFDQLVQMSDWNQGSGAEAYRALALEHFSEFGVRIREDLRTDFAAAAESYYQRQLEEWRRIAAKPVSPTTLNLLTQSKSSLWSAFLQERTEPVESTPESSAQSSVSWHKAGYLKAALAGLARNGSPDDLKFGREFLSHSDDDVRIEAVRVVRQFGNAEDIPELMKIAKSSSGLLQELAARTTLSVSSNQSGIAEELLATGDEVLVSITVAELIAHGDKEKISDFLSQHLYDDNEKVRTRVMAFFIFRYDNQELESLLAQYTSKAIYYYDVVCCFDRFLYAPPRLTSSYRKFVESSFFGLLVIDSEPTKIDSADIADS